MELREWTIENNVILIYGKKYIKSQVSDSNSITASR